MIGGFEQPTSGLIELQGEDVTWLPPYQRNVNTVFQNYALFPHLTIFENVAFGLRRKGVKGAEIKSRVTDMLELVELPGFERAQADPDLGRPGAARRPRAGAHQPAGRPPPRRAAGRPRPQAAQADAGRAQAHPAGGRDHVHLRDPRPGGGDDDVRPHRRDEQGPVRAAGRPGDAVRAPDDAVRRGLPRRQQPARRRAARAPPTGTGIIQLARRHDRAGARPPAVYGRDDGRRRRPARRRSASTRTASRHAERPQPPAGRRRRRLVHGRQHPVHRRDPRRARGSWSTSRTSSGRRRTSCGPRATRST